MHLHQITAAMLVALSCALGAAACVQPPDPASETEATSPPAPAIETSDESNPFGDPGDDPGIGSPPPAPTSPPLSREPPSSGAGREAGDSAEPEGWFTYNLCTLLKNSGASVRGAFCVSQPACDVRARCRTHVNDSPVAWQGWCYNEFRNE